MERKRHGSPQGPLIAALVAAIAALLILAAPHIAASLNYPLLSEEHLEAVEAFRNSGLGQFRSIAAIAMLLTAIVCLLDSVFYDR